jgi:dephospho-CoA kinase
LGGGARVRSRVDQEGFVTLVVGLTGNIAAGKSTVAKRLRRLGATVIDADKLAREAVGAGSAALGRIVERWGSDVLTPDGTLDRAALRKLVFHDHDQLEQLNRIVHPAVTRLRADRIAQARARGDRVVICEVPLLFERHLVDKFDRIILVDAPRPLRLERLVQERGLDEAEALAMIAAQMPADLKRARADFVIDNTGDLAELDARVAELWSELTREAASFATPVTA